MVPDVQRVFGMACLRDTQVIKPAVIVSQQSFYRGASVQVFAVLAPSTDDLVCPLATFQNVPVIFWSDRIGRGPHFSGIRVAPGKNICDPETAEAQRPCPTLAAFDGRIIVNLCSGRWVQHYEMHALASVVPDP